MTRLLILLMTLSSIGCSDEEDDVTGDPICGLECHLDDCRANRCDPDDPVYDCTDWDHPIFITERCAALLQDAGSADAHR